ncbi:ThiF family adenylyltransferase [Brevibacillus sp. NRS-1366]|uniref:ThiF family adenylyltransferase n=1 Tax=Brevibacillus sp. NRS-1366 TaxID=3233899 RepID=UPI003D19A40E
MQSRSGVGTITIIDRDYVEWSNLQRQSLYAEKVAIDKLPKAVAGAASRMRGDQEISYDALALTYMKETEV